MPLPTIRKLAPAFTAPALMPNKEFADISLKDYLGMYILIIYIDLFIVINYYYLFINR